MNNEGCENESFERTLAYSLHENAYASVSSLPNETHRQQLEQHRARPFEFHATGWKAGHTPPWCTVQKAVDVPLLYAVESGHSEATLRRGDLVLTLAGVHAGCDYIMGNSVGKVMEVIAVNNWRQFEWYILHV